MLQKPTHFALALLVGSFLGSSLNTATSVAFAGPNPFSTNTKAAQTAAWSGEDQSPVRQAKVDKVVDGLGLTPDKANQLKTLLHEQKQDRKAQWVAMKAKHKALHEMLSTGSGSEQEALTLQRELAQLHNQQMEHHISTVYSIKSMLTPEQFQQFQSGMRQLHSERMKKGGPAS